MRRTNCSAGVIVIAITLPILTTGCTRDYSLAYAGAHSPSGAVKSAPEALTVAENNLPEVVITARIEPSTVATVSADRVHRP